MLYLLAIVLPPVAVYRAGRPWQVALNVLLTSLFWVPGVLHAFRVIGFPGRTMAAVMLDGPGRYTIEVRGESNYQEDLRAIVGRRSNTSIRKRTQAALVPEPTNRHDRNAVRVYIDGRLVGYLAREEARRYARVFRTLHERKHAGVCNAVIVGGGKRERGRGRKDYGVWVDLATPAALLNALKS